MLPESERLSAFLGERKLKPLRKISKGFSSETHLVEEGSGRKLLLKLERVKSPRENMAEKEFANLKLANSVGVGPKAISMDAENRVVLMEFVAGPHFNEWLFSSPSPQPEQLYLFVRQLFSQAEKLDAVGLDHGQLAGKGKNIMVADAESGKPKPVIIDFEKASTNRKVHNLSTMKSFLLLNPKSAVVKKVAGILQGREKDFL